MIGPGHHAYGSPQPSNHLLRLRTIGRRPARVIVFSLAVVLAFFALSGTAMADVTTYYVAVTGADSNPGTLSAPLRTVQAAVATASAGDVILVREGTYDDRVLIDTGNAAPNLTLRAYPGERPRVSQGFRIGQSGTTLDGFEVSSSSITDTHGYTVQAGIEVRANDVTVANCYIHHLSDNSGTLSVRKYHGIKVDGARTGVRITGNTITYTGYHGVIIEGAGAAQAYIGGNTIDHAGYDSGATAYNNSFGMGIWVNGTGCVVEDNTVTYPWQNCILSLGTRNIYRHNDLQAIKPHAVSSFHKTCIYEETGASGNVYDGNVFRQSAGTLFEIDSNAAINVTLINNLFLGPQTYAAGVMLKSTASAVPKYARVRNNVFLVRGINLSAYPQNWADGSVSVSNNVFAGGTSMISAASGTYDHHHNLYRSSVEYPDSGGPTGSERTGDPLFVNQAAGDFHLRASSPAVDGADGTDAPLTDRAGTSRIDDPSTPNTGAGTPVFADIGAYEYEPPADTTPPVTTAVPDRLTASSGWYVDAPMIELVANEPSTVRYSWDSSATVASTIYSSALKAPVGQHVLYFFATDGSGNTEIMRSVTLRVSSAPVAVAAIPKVGAPLVRSSSGFRAGGLLTVSGRWYYRVPTRVRVSIYRRVAGTWTRYAIRAASFRTVSSTAGPYVVRFRIRKRGSWRVTAVASYATGNDVRSASTPFRLR